MDYSNEQKAKLFDALFADGVDNWEGFQQENYQKATEEIELENKYDQVQKELEPLFEVIETHIEVDYPAGREAGTRTALTEDGVGLIVAWITKKYHS